MIARLTAGVAGLVALAAVLVIVLSGGSKPYVIKMQLADADGLRQGSPVAIGGQDVGTISMAVQHARVIVTMNVNPADGPVGRDATASVASVNLLGQKRIELFKGNVADPARSGYMLPAADVTVTTDLDQVLDVLAPDVRARLGILINEAGTAFAGRQADFSQMLLQLPPDFHAGEQLLNGISANNHTLADLVQSSDTFVTQLARQRTQLVHVIKVFGEASSTVAARRSELAATLAQAPPALATLQTFLTKLQATTVPLAPAARDITATAPVLTSTLAQLNPFRQAAVPTLNEATHVAPDLTRLATGATPVVQQATPVVGQLATFSQSFAPISDIVNHSVDNLVAILQNWSRAIQLRDGLSHIFRGEYGFTPQIVTSMINQLEQAGVLGSLSRAAAQTTKTQAGSQAQKRPAGAGGSSATSATPAAGSASHASSSSSPVTPAAPTPTQGSGGSNGGLNLGSLLSFLLKP
jgi:phospholipid/cholesterol/gamma-HCH transport system substrate-binding protein